MDVVNSVVLEITEDQLYPAPEKGKARVEIPIRDYANAMRLWENPGALGAVLSHLSNTQLTYKLGPTVVEYLWDTNEHPTLIQGVLNICWTLLLAAGERLEDYHADRRLEAGKKLTTQLVKEVDLGTYPGNLPCV